ncbi:MAG: glutamyl-tRNA reductase [Cyclobacteriaceae bacterium]|nr:glutamyl-tRNA reductase [Cyclobacteriaceae bacterium]
MMEQGNFFAIGVSFKKTDIAHRSKFAFTPDQCEALYRRTNIFCFQNFFILSTCNRTELYGFAPCEYVPLTLLQQHTGLTQQELMPYVYVKKDSEAVHHFFSVASGLDSQIPGDYEITAQIKSAFQLAKEHRHTNGYLERLFNFGLQASKEVKTTTSFSNGTVSVMYTAVQQLANKKGINNVLVLGAGQTAQQVITYLKKFMPDTVVTLVNRDTVKGIGVAREAGVAYQSFGKLPQQLKHSDAVMVATHATQPLITRSLLKNTSIKHVYDLSVPQNVSADVATLRHIELQNVDSISVSTNATLQSRLAEIPKVKKIIRSYKEKFMEWAARHHYFSVASRASVAGHGLPRRELTSSFNEWHKSFQSGSVLPYSAQATATIVKAIQASFPSARLIHSTYNKSETHETCHPHCHPNQSACVMASQCGLHAVAASR